MLPVQSLSALVAGSSKNPRKTRGRSDSDLFAHVRSIAKPLELQSSPSVTIRRSCPKTRSQGGGESTGRCHLSVGRRFLLDRLGVGRLRALAPAQQRPFVDAAGCG